MEDRIATWSKPDAYMCDAGSISPISFPVLVKVLLKKNLIMVGQDLWGSEAVLPEFMYSFIYLTITVCIPQGS